MYNVPFQLYKRTLVKRSGVNIETYVADYQSFCSCINYASNEMSIADLKAKNDLWTMETHYTPLIETGDHIKLLDDNSEYEIIGVPENVRRANKVIRFKGLRISG